MVGELTPIVDLVGNGLDSAFGLYGLFFLGVIFFLMIGAWTKASGEVIMVFLFGLIMLFTIYMGLPSYFFIAMVVIGSVLVFLMVSRLIFK